MSKFDYEQIGMDLGDLTPPSQPVEIEQPDVPEVEVEPDVLDLLQPTGLEVVLEKSNLLLRAVKKIRQSQLSAKQLGYDNVFELKEKYRQEGVALGQQACQLCEHYDRCRIKNDDNIWEQLEGYRASTTFLNNLIKMKEMIKQTDTDVMCGKLLIKNYFKK
ncbi:MAG: hypothetical protein LBL08_02900 [Candidatus Nomurabacteria bacterium]|jgi:hypothetical protein|nr:hypothetical protein [Candidatus Nomurabacteria bacterium]